ncbi:MAG: hypothetical protein IT436_00975 [Phycisphaerales bacterium]|nr:hypothetical protein [Phycisphaerales bacterium]
MSAPAGQPVETFTPAEAASDPLQVYLASRDVGCPHCHYNLRGVTAPACPECGRAIELQLAGVRRYWVPPIFMFLAFGWMLIAGSMNTYRNVNYAWNAASRVSTIYFGSTTTIVRPGVTITTGPTGSLQISQSGFSSGPSWSNVSADIWIRLAWSTFLILAAILGLAILWRHLSKPLSARAWARARLLAICAFTIYAGFHLYWFAIEML